MNVRSKDDQTVIKLDKAEARLIKKATSLINALSLYSDDIGDLSKDMKTLVSDRIDADGVFNPTPTAT